MSGDAIGDFWAWWATRQDAFAQAFDGGEPPGKELVDALSEHVAAIDESLDWEFGPGVRSKHHLCLSAKGDPALRVVTERWLRRAPAPSATWEYYPSRQATPATELSLRIAGQEVSLAEFVFEVKEDASRELLDVSAFHPAFPSMTQKDLRLQVLFIALDNLLGEDGVERWLGSVDLAAKAPSDAVPYAGLRARVDELAKRATRERWAVLKGQHEGKPVFITANLAIKRVDHLLLDMHLTVELPLLAPTEHGLTTNEEASALDAVEDDLVATMGEHALLLGRLTTGGLRTVHMRVMEGGPARTLVERWAARHPERRPAIAVDMDPRWERREWR